MASNLLIKDGANQDRYIQSEGSGTTDASPVLVHHIVRLRDTNGSALATSSCSPLGTELALITRPIPSGTQTITGSISITGVVDVKQGTASALNFTLPSGTEVRQSNASALKATAEVYQANASAFQVTAEVRQATASALQITATQATDASGWTVRVVTPSGDTAMDSANSAVRSNVVAATTVDVKQTTGSALNATVLGAVEVRQASTSALKAIAEVNQAVASALNATVVGAVEVRQASTSALKAIAEVNQATASALNATVTQATAASGWTVRVVTPSGDTAMDTSNSAVRVNLVAGGAGNGNLQDGAASQITATVRGYANASPLAVSLTDASGINIPTLPVSLGSVSVNQSNASALRATAEVNQATASALQATVTQATNASGFTVRVVTPSGDTSMDSANSAVRVNIVAGGAGDGNLQDGAASQIKATVRGYANASPLAVSLTDSSGINIPTLPVSIAGVVDVKQTTASALNATVTQATNASGWTVRVVTPSGDTSMDTANSALRVNIVAGGAGDGNLQDGAASQIKATVRGYANASPLAVSLTDSSGINIPTLPVSIAGVVDVKQTTASALNATIVGAVEVRQASTSALKAIAEVNQAVASALNATITQATNASGWTVRVVTPSGDTAMDSANSAVRVNVVTSITQDVKQTTASALNATVVGGVEVRQASTSALKGIMEVFQANGSALTMHGEVQQLAASALKATAEVYQATASALNAQVVGELAHDAVDAGNPLKIGGKALSASPTNVAGNDRTNTYYDLAGRLMVRDGNQGQDNWTATCAPLNSNVRATITRTAGAANVRQICTGFTATVTGGSAAPTASIVYAYLLDGTSGTNYLWKAVLGVQATAGATAGVARHGLWIKSSQASALTLEFDVAANNVVESVSMEGTTITEA